MIIFINGSINSGKSTVSKLLIKELPKTALIEIDFFHEMIEWMPIDQAVPLNLQNAVSVIKNFAHKDLNVIVPYPLSQKNYDYMMDNLKEVNTRIYIFTLAPKIEKTLTNRGTRELNDWERKRIQHHYDIGIHNPNFGEIIDNTDQTAEETAKLILAKII
jgi:cytidylate kinase